MVRSLFDFAADGVILGRFSAPREGGYHAEDLPKDAECETKAIQGIKRGFLPVTSFMIP